MQKYKIVWTNKGSLVYEEHFFTQNVHEAILHLALRSKELANATFDEVKLVRAFEDNQ